MSPPSSRSSRRQQCSTNITTIAILTVAVLFVSFGIATAQNQCTTPRNEPGVCIVLKNCSSLVDLINARPISDENRKFLLNSQCGTEGSSPKVCCANSAPTPSDACSTPNSLPGKCIILDSCKVLFDILQKRPVSAEDASYLSRSQCGLEGRRPKVCCPTAPDPTLPTAKPDVAETDFDTGNGLAARHAFLPEECGKEAIATRIINGEKTRLLEFPWMALLRYRKGKTERFACGGAMISERYVLTAAHCVKGDVVSAVGTLINVRLGEYDTQNETDCLRNQGCSEPPQNFNIEEVIPHEEWINGDKHQYHDIALIRLDKPAQISKFVRPICLYNKNQVIKTDERQFVAGWGRTENNTNSNVKLKLGVPIKTLQTCHVIYSQPRFGVLLREDIQICAGGETAKDSCQGDSGGPLMRFDLTDSSGDPIWYATGVVSFGPKPCAQPNWPGIYTNVPRHINWILAHMRP